MRWMAALAFLTSLAVYAPTLDHYFVSDDFLNQERNVLATLTDVFHCFATTHVDFYRPLPRLYFGLLQGFAPNHPLVWNLTAVVLHALVSTFAGLLAFDLFGRNRRFVAVGTAVFFALHFIHVESVVWASGITSVLDGLFLFAALFWFRKARRTGQLRDQLLSVVAFAGALLSKESSLAFVFLLPLTTWMSPPRDARGNATPAWPSWRESLPYVILIVAYLVIVIPIDRGGDLSPYRMTIGPHAVKNLVFFTLGSFLPLRYWELQDLWVAAQGGALGVVPAFLEAVGRRPDFVVALSVSGAAIAFALAKGGRVVRLLFAWIIFAASPHLLLPGSGERFLYVPSFGACVLLALGLEALWMRGPGRLDRVAFFVAATLILGSHLAGNLDRQGDWSTASRWTRGIVGRWSFFRSLDPTSSIEFVGIPDRWGSAWVFRNGFDSMVRSLWEGRPYWREEERPIGRVPNERMGVVLHPEGMVGMLPAQFLREGHAGPFVPDREAASEDPRTR